MATTKAIAQAPQPRRSVAAVLAALAETRLREAQELRELALALEAGDGDEWVAHTEVAGHTPRAAAELMRSGRIAGAVKNGKRWLAKRSAVDAYIASGKPAKVGGDDIGQLIEMNLRRAR